MLYLIGLGLNEKSISLEALEAIKKCKRVYLDSYTSEFPYSIKKLEKIIKKKMVSLKREDIEGGFLIEKSKKENICLLVYGSPLFATTHISLIEDCRLKKINFKIIYNASVFDAISESGLQLYKFGKIISMPKWYNNFKPVSFLDVISENKKINLHSVILIDPGLSFNDALEQMILANKDKKIKLEKILVCSQLGFRPRIYYGEISKLQKFNNIKNPFCFIVPGKMHFMEEKVVEGFLVN